MIYEVLPVHLQIEPCQLCNLNCLGCSIRDVHKKEKRGILTLDDFKILISHSPSVNDISLHGLGEPFFNNDLSKIAILLNNKGIVARTVTNGNVINPNIDSKVMLENLKEICFSIDGDDKNTYETIRSDGDFDKFKKVVSSFSEAKAKGNFMSCLLSFNCIISKINIDNVSGIPALAKELGIDKVIFNFMGQFYYSKKDDNYKMVEEIRNLDTKSLLSLMEMLSNECGKLEIEISYPAIGKKRHYDCFWPIRAAFVTAEGYVTPCNYRMNPKELSFGNLLTQTMEEIWLSKRYLDFRKNYYEKNYYDFCLTCS